MAQAGTRLRPPAAARPDATVGAGVPQGEDDVPADNDAPSAGGPAESAGPLAAADRPAVRPNVPPTSSRHELGEGGGGEAGGTQVLTRYFTSPRWACGGGSAPLQVVWRNAFTTVTFVRILQKLSKNKPARIRTLMDLHTTVRVGVRGVRMARCANLVVARTIGARGGSPVLGHPGACDQATPGPPGVLRVQALQSHVALPWAQVAAKYAMALAPLAWRTRSVLIRGKRGGVDPGNARVASAPSAHMRLITSIYMSVTMRSSDAALLTSMDDAAPVRPVKPRFGTKYLCVPRVCMCVC